MVILRNLARVVCFFWVNSENFLLVLLADNFLQLYNIAQSDLGAVVNFPS